VPKGSPYQIEFVMIALRPDLTQAARIVAWSLAAAIVVLSVVPPALRPETAAPHNFEHFLIYWTMGLAFGLGFKRRLGLLAILLSVFTGFVEIAQLLVPGRHARLSDFLVDAVAMWFGLIGVSMFRQVRDARHNH
jgi:VanZ family protein